MAYPHPSRFRVSAGRGSRPERRRTLTALRVIWSPVAAMEAVARERKVGLGFGVVALEAALALASVAITLVLGADQFAPESFQGVPPEIAEGLSTGLRVGLPVSTALSPFVWWVVVALLMQLVTRFFGGSGPLPAMFAVVGVAAAPFVLAALIGLPLTAAGAVADPQSASAAVLGLLNVVLTLAFLIWHVALVVVGAKFARNVSYGESGGSCAISCAGCLGLVVLAVLGIALIGVLLGGG